MVYGFKIWSESQGRYRVSKYKAPREVLARYDVEIISETAQVIARSELDGKGRYLSEENRFAESSFRSSSFDLQSGLQVIEDPPVRDRRRRRGEEATPRNRPEPRAGPARPRAPRRQPRQNCEVSSTSTGSSSIRPSSMPNVQTQVWKSVSDA